MAAIDARRAELGTTPVPSRRRYSASRSTLRSEHRLMASLVKCRAIHGQHGGRAGSAEPKATRVRGQPPPARAEPGRGGFRTSDLSSVKRRADQAQKPHQQATCGVTRPGSLALRITRNHARYRGFKSIEPDTGAGMGLGVLLGPRALAESVLREAA